MSSEQFIFLFFYFFFLATFSYEKLIFTGEIAKNFLY